MTPLLSKSPITSFGTFLHQCHQFLGIDISPIRATAIASIWALRHPKKDRADKKLAQQLEQQWYRSLVSGTPDYSVYAVDAYLGELWACWVVYSRRYLRALYPLTSRGSLGAVQRVVDLGCGHGYTTAALCELFPQAHVTGTNLESTEQMLFARSLAPSYGFDLVSDVTQISSPVDLVFASEYFEHILSPLAHLSQVIECLLPRALLIANTFTSPSVGHFPSYDINGQLYSGHLTSKYFNQILRQRGFQQMETGFWNNRPTLWVRALAALAR